MVFQVGLIAGIKAEIIEHGIHARIVRIVRGANQVHIVLLHQQDVAQHRLVRHGTTALGIGVLAVHALEKYALTIDVHQGVGQFDFAETIFRAPRHFLTAGRIVLTEAEGVEMGRFGRPVGHVLQVKFHLLARQLHVLAGRRLELPALRSHFLAVGTVHIERHSFGFCLFRRVAQSEVDRHSRVAIVVAQHIGDAMIVDRGRGQTIKVDIAEDTAHTEHILAFEIRTVAPAHHLHRKAVFAGTQIGGEIVFTHVVRSLTIAHFVAVKPDCGGRVDATEMDDRAATVPRSRQREGAHIRAHGVDAVVRPTVVVARARHDVRRRVGVGILHIAVDGVVITEHLPVGRHGDVVPTAHIETVLEEIGRALRGFAHEVEFPCAVEREIAFAHGHCPRRSVVSLVGQHFTFRSIGLESGVTGQTIDGENRFVFPAGRLNFGFVHFVERHPSRAILHIEGHDLHLIAAQGEHLALLVVGSDHIGVCFAGHRHDGQLRIAGAVHLRRPLQEIVDRGIVAAVVKVLGEIGIAHHTTREVEHLDVPILSAVHRIFAFGHDACAVFGQFAVTEHEAGTIHEAQAISLRFVEARNIGQGGTEHRMFVTACGGQVFEHGLARGVQTQAHRAAGSRHEEVAPTGSRFGTPHLVLVRSVDFTGFNAVAGKTKRALREGVDDAPCPGEWSQRPILFATRGVDFRGLHSFATHIEHFRTRRRRRQAIERSLAPLGRVGTRTEGKSAQQERAKGFFDHVHKKETCLLLS